MKRLYVLVRKDLNPAYRSVQAGHAVAEYLLRYPRTEWNNGYLIYLGVHDRMELVKWKTKLEYKNIDYVVFREPDLHDEETTLALLSDGKIVKSLRCV